MNSMILLALDILLYELLNCVHIDFQESILATICIIVGRIFCGITIAFLFLWIVKGW